MMTSWYGKLYWCFHLEGSVSVYSDLEEACKRENKHTPYNEMAIKELRDEYWEKRIYLMDLDIAGKDIDKWWAGDLLLQMPNSSNVVHASFYGQKKKFKCHEEVGTDIQWWLKRFNTIFGGLNEKGYEQMMDFIAENETYPQDPWSEMHKQYRKGNHSK